VRYVMKLIVDIEYWCAGRNRMCSGDVVCRISPCTPFGFGGDCLKHQKDAPHWQVPIGPREL